MAKPKRSRGEYRARQIFQKELRKIDREANRAKPKPPEVKGPRAIFLEKCQEEGYEKAKAAVNARFDGREVFTDEILIGWLGIRQKIVDAYKKGTIKDAYKKADKINDEIGYLLLKKENIDIWIAEESEKEKKKLNQKNTGENDGSR